MATKLVRGRWAAFALATVGLACIGQLASAQEVKPYVMLLVDTSGSMIWDLCNQGYSCVAGCGSSCNTSAGCGGCNNCPGPYSVINGDNSAECQGKDVSCSLCNTLGCGDGLFNDARLYKVKKGAFSVVSAFGEVTFALSRFHQTPATFTCDAVNYERIGGWRGASGDINGFYACSANGINNDPMGSGWNQADVLVGFSDTNQVQVLRWLNNCKDWPTPGTSCGSAGGNPPTTGCSLCLDCAGGCDYELRGSGNTPLAGSLYDLRTTFYNGSGGVIASDTKSSCRPYKLIVLTDGQNNCQGDPVQQAQLLYTNASKSIPVHVVGFGQPALKPYLDQIAAGGGTSKAVVVDNEVSLALAMASIISESIMKEKCNGIDDNCNQACDEDWPEVAVTGAACTNKHAAQTCTVGVGICQRTGVYVCKADGSGSQCSVTPGPPGPGGEICGNALDDNCNGIVDEGCVPCVPQPEICDGKDNDCDGKTDEDYVPVPCGSSIGECKQGMTACVAGKVVCNGAKGPGTEICDGKDNNCDTIIDNFSEVCYPPTSGCDLGTGVCKGVCQIGSRLCTASAWKACVGYQGPATEVCNGLDDDCDGVVDNGVGFACLDYTTCTAFNSCAACPSKPAEVCDGKDNDCDGKTDDVFPEKGKPCGSNVGECKAGTWGCVGGKLVCQGEVGSTAEICDGKDNDCNGAIDDKVPGEGQPCGSSIGECKPGLTKCIAAKYECVGGVGPTKEICDGKDNDCDGKTDTNAECPGGAACLEGKCLVPCGSGEFNCPGGTKCVNKYCVPDPCAKVSCKPTERCNNGTCVEKCASVTCNEHERCEPTTGWCVDDSCISKGCPKGEVCVGYACVPDPCGSVKCSAGQFCSAGTCYDTCLNVKCGAGEVCSKGKCVKNPCEGYPCDSTFVCKVKGGVPACEPDPCRVITCSKGQICWNGTCVGDPCGLTRCPEGLRCELNSLGEADCKPIPGQTIPETHQLLASGGGGCACRVGGELGDGVALLPLLLGLALARRWRARRRR